MAKIISSLIRVNFDITLAWMMMNESTFVLLLMHRCRKVLMTTIIMGWFSDFRFNDSDFHFHIKNFTHFAITILTTGAHNERPGGS